MTSATSCRTCGTNVVEDARFCHSCGSPVIAQDTPAEFKQVTVLFADVVRSMDIASKVGAERLREIIGELVNAATAVVERYGGTVDMFTGDGLMATFGAPRALEDHAIRACLAALDVQRENAILATAVLHRDGMNLQLRIGLNSGQVIAGEIGSGALGYTAIGEQVGLAQRMESVAPPGGVMLSESTARLVESDAELSPPESSCRCHDQCCCGAPVSGGPRRRRASTRRDRHRARRFRTALADGGLGGAGTGTAPPNGGRTGTPARTRN